MYKFCHGDKFFPSISDTYALYFGQIVTLFGDTLINEKEIVQLKTNKNWRWDAGWTETSWSLEVRTSTDSRKDCQLNVLAFVVDVGAPID